MIGVLAVVVHCIGLLHSSQLRRISHTSLIQRSRQYYGRKEMVDNDGIVGSNKDIDDAVESDLNNEVFMELIANQKKIRHNKKQNKIKIQPAGPEFSRIVNIEQVPGTNIHSHTHACNHTHSYIHDRETSRIM